MVERVTVHSSLIYENSTSHQRNPCHPPLFSMSLYHEEQEMSDYLRGKIGKSPLSGKFVLGGWETPEFRETLDDHPGA